MARTLALLWNVTHTKPAPCHGWQRPHDEPSVVSQHGDGIYRHLSEEGLVICH